MFNYSIIIKNATINIFVNVTMDMFVNQYLGYILNLT